MAFSISDFLEVNVASGRGAGGVMVDDDLVVLDEEAFASLEAGFVAPALFLSFMGRLPKVICGSEAIDPEMSAISRDLRAESSAWIEWTWAFSICIL